jgi:hypothetical protein
MTQISALLVRVIARRGAAQGMCRPEMARATTRRWISEVPSKIV